MNFNGTAVAVGGVLRRTGLREIGCEDCEAHIQHLARSRSLTVREREALWRAINTDCDSAGCPRECSTRGLIGRVSSNLVTFVAKLNRHERQTHAGCDRAVVSVCQNVSI
jgi:hypothetical protein